MKDVAFLPDGIKLQIQPGYVLALRITPPYLDTRQRAKLEGQGRIASSFPLVRLMNVGTTKLGKGDVYVAVLRDTVCGKPILRCTFEGLRADEVLMIPAEALVAKANVSAAQWMGGKAPAGLEEIGGRPKKGLPPRGQVNPESLAAPQPNAFRAPEDPDAVELAAREAQVPKKAPRAAKGENMAQQSARSKAEAAAALAQEEAAARTSGA